MHARSAACRARQRYSFSAMAATEFAVALSIRTASARLYRPCLTKNGIATSAAHWNLLLPPHRRCASDASGGSERTVPSTHRKSAASQQQRKEEDRS